LEKASRAFLTLIYHTVGRVTDRESVSSCAHRDNRQAQK